MEIIEFSVNSLSFLSLGTFFTSFPARISFLVRDQSRFPQSGILVAILIIIYSWFFFFFQHYNYQLAILSHGHILLVFLVTRPVLGISAAGVLQRWEQCSSQQCTSSLRTAAPTLILTTTSHPWRCLATSTRDTPSHWRLSRLFSSPTVTSTAPATPYPGEPSSPSAKQS